MRRIPLNLLIGGLLIGFVLLLTWISIFWTPYNPSELNFPVKLAPPSAAHWLGTDEFGRDIASRIMVGAQASVSVGFLTIVLTVLFGATIGLISGYARGWPDRILMAFNNVILAFPGILLALSLLTVTGANLPGIVLALSLAYTPAMARVVRGAVLSLREAEFVEASRVMGNSETYTVLRHVLPNCVAPISVLATSMFGTAILSESALSFLGLGVPPPAPTWGNMLASGRPFIAQAVWLGLFPGLCISLTLLGANLLGDALRDKLDPRMRNL